MKPFTHLLDIDSLDDPTLSHVLADATDWADGQPAPELAGRSLINCFFEASTRTRISFEMAARRLGISVINMSEGQTSVVKGESLEDTFDTLAAMQPDLIVVRHARNGVPAALAARAPDGVHVVNAGDGTRAHPSQALLDVLTLRRAGIDLARSRLLIVGDLRHSRVARSHIRLLQRLGIGELRLAAPAPLLPDYDCGAAQLYQHLDEAIQGADVVMALRIQRERMEGGAGPGGEAYYRDWGLTRERLADASPACRVMHPGPMNRGVEIDSEVADGPQSLIREQVRNGVYLRMAILYRLLMARV